LTVNFQPADLQLVRVVHFHVDDVGRSHASMTEDERPILAPDVAHQGDNVVLLVDRDHFDHLVGGADPKGQTEVQVVHEPDDAADGQNAHDQSEDSRLLSLLPRTRPPFPLPPDDQATDGSDRAREEHYVHDQTDDFTCEHDGTLSTDYTTLDSDFFWLRPGPLPSIEYDSILYVKSQASSFVDDLSLGGHGFSRAP
jgi:hypothetical protein